MFAWANALYDFWPLQVYLWLLAGLFAFGAYVHLSNIFGFRGQKWRDWPLHWQIADIVLLVLDVTVIAGAVLRHGIAVFAFLVTAGLQMVLYGFVPHRFAETPAQAKALRSIIYLDVALLAVFAGLLVARHFLG
jgi:hypothetical protein